jgi:class 3 adenylate cyclase
MGDGMLAEFPSAVQARQAAVGMQERTQARNGGLLEGRQIQVRMGVHQGDVVVEGNDLLGDGVNIAARLEARRTGSPSPKQPLALFSSLSPNYGGSSSSISVVDPSV